jgi:outer membrane autotransporter protein
MTFLMCRIFAEAGRARLSVGASLIAIAAATAFSGSARAGDITADTTVTTQQQLDALGSTINIAAPNRLTVSSASDLLFSGEILNENYSFAPPYGKFDKAGTGTLTLHDATISKGEAYVTGGTLKLTGDNVIDYLAVGSGAGGVGTMTIGDGASVAFGVTLSVGDWGGTGTVNQTGGTVTINPTCPSSGNCSSFLIGNQGGSGVYNISGGLLEMYGGNNSIGRNSGGNEPGEGTLNISGGTVALHGVTWGQTFSGGKLIIGDRDDGTKTNSTGLIRQTGGTLHVENLSLFYMAGYGSGRYDLLGGTLEIGGESLKARYNNQSSTYAFNLGGGTIQVIETKLMTASDLDATLQDDTVSTFDTNGFGADWKGKLLGTGGLRKIGSDDLSIATLADTISGLRIEEGDVLVGSNLLFAGSSAETGLDIAVGSKLKVTGNFSLGDGDIFTTAIDDNGSAGWIEVTGTANLDGILSIDATAGYLADHAYTIVTAGSFAQADAEDNFAFANTNFAFVTPELSYLDSGTLQLTLASNGTEFVDVAVSGNQRAAAAGLQSVGSGELYSAVQLLSEEEAETAFDNISGESNATSGATVLNGSQSVRGVVHSRLQHAGKSSAPTVSHASGYAEAEKRSSAPFPGMASAPEIDPNTFWTQGYGSWGHTKGDGNAAGVDRTGGGVMIGYDRGFGQDWLLGVAAGYSRSNFDVDDRSSSGKVDSYNLLAYASGDVGQVKLRVGAGYSWNDIDSTRNVILPNFAEQVTASYSSGAAQLFGEVSHDFTVSPSTTLTPFAGLAYVHVSTDDYSEQGGSSALSVAGADDSVTYASLGLRAEHSVLVGATTVTLQGSAAWQHAWGDLAPVRTVAFAGGDSFQTIGAPIAQDAALLQAGFDVDVTAGAKVGVFYMGQIASGASDNSVQGRFSVAF